MYSKGRNLWWEYYLGIGFIADYLVFVRAYVPNRPDNTNYNWKSYKLRKQETALLRNRLRLSAKSHYCKSFRCKVQRKDKITLQLLVFYVKQKPRTNVERDLGTLQSEYLRMPDSGMYPQILISISILQQRDKAFKTGPNSGSLLIAPCQSFPRMSKNLEHFWNYSYQKKPILK